MNDSVCSEGAQLTWNVERYGNNGGSSEGLVAL